MATPAEIKKWLKASKTGFAEAAKRAKESGPGYATLDDGRYTARLTGAEMGSAQSSGKMQVVLSYTVLEGKDTGEIIKDFNSLEREDGPYYFCLTLAALGVDLDTFNPEKLDDTLSALVEEKPVVVLRLSTKGDFQNKRIIKLLGADYEPDPDAEDAEAEAEAEAEPEAEAEAEAEDEEEADVKIGQIVRYPWQGDTADGEIVEILEDQGKIKVRTVVDGKAKLRTIDPANASLVSEVEPEADEDEEEEEEAPVPPTTTGKKPGKK